MPHHYPLNLTKYLHTDLIDYSLSPQRLTCAFNCEKSHRSIDKVGCQFFWEKSLKILFIFWVAIMDLKINFFWEKQGKENLFPVIFPSEIPLISYYSHWSTTILSNLQNELALCMNLVMWCWVQAISGNWWTCSQTGQTTLVLWRSLSFHGVLTRSSFLLIYIKLFISYLLLTKPANQFKT